METAGVSEREGEAGEATALNIIIGVLTNENTGRESEAPAELFRPRDRPQVLVDAKWPPHKAPQERRSPVMMPPPGLEGVRVDYYRGMIDV